MYTSDDPNGHAISNVLANRITFEQLQWNLACLLNVTVRCINYICIKEGEGQRHQRSK